MKDMRNSVLERSKNDEPPASAPEATLSEFANVADASNGLLKIVLELGANKTSILGEALCLFAGIVNKFTHRRALSQNMAQISVD